MNLKEARKSRGLTQQELSNLCGIAQGDISKIETGKSNVTFETMSRIARALDMELVVEFREKENGN